MKFVRGANRPYFCFEYLDLAMTSVLTLSLESTEITEGSAIMIFTLTL
jgi:hypothetical protein